MECPRCHNQNAARLYQIGGRYYCRECLSFQRVWLDEKRKTRRYAYPQRSVTYTLDFTLSPSQQKISHQLVENYQHHLNSLVLAVCGSGKTEIVFELIQYALSQGHRVCFCIPRRELVKELVQRLQEAFLHIPIGIVYGGYVQNLKAQLIICTMHQLYRFENDIGFDLMIADEVDAFPFYGNRVLQELFQRCCMGSYVKLSATFVQEDIQDEELLIMNRRYHGYDLPVPRLILCPHCLQSFFIGRLICRLQKKVIVFVPCIDDVDVLIKRLRRQTHRRIAGVSSWHTENQETVERFKNGYLDVIVSTTLLERGVTIEDVQVIVYHGEHVLFDRRTLIQMAGRVGRKVSHPQGYVYIIASERTSSIKQCIHTIRNLNTMSV